MFLYPRPAPDNVPLKLRAARPRKHTHTQSCLARKLLRCAKKNKIATLFVSFFVLLCPVIALKKNMIVARICFPDFFYFFMRNLNCTLSFDITTHICTKSVSFDNTFVHELKMLHTNRKTLEGSLVLCLTKISM